MICKYCGKTIPDGSVYCSFCGKKVESHIRAEDSREEYENEYENQEYEYEEPKGKRVLKAFISIIAAIIFVAAAFYAIMHFVKPYLGEEPWGDKEDTAQTEEEEQSGPLKTMYVTAEEGLILRDGPGQDSEAIHILNYGQEIQVEKLEVDWAYTTVDGVSGWCSTEYLTEEKIVVEQKEKTPESEEDRSNLVEPATRIENGLHGVVNSEGGLNLRCGPGQEYDILLVVPYEAEVVEEGRDGDWIFIKHDGQYGWINSQYINPIQ